MPEYQERSNRKRDNFHERKDFADSPRYRRRQASTVRRIQAFIAPLLRPDQKSGGADPEEEEDDINQDADEGVDATVVLCEGIGADMGEDAVDCDQYCEERSDD